ncbi:hypothetical protein RRG08_036458 [Elysia crispata]|uniref:Uncharacterized protein n=1 Tax=Elysia crispata TaxID=231223 RepID=A0AAE0ZJZ3_9GAST|nr:hypothetical protein RRG08_036458 [Elysia crispata]
MPSKRRLAEGTIWKKRKRLTSPVAKKPSSSRAANGLPAFGQLTSFQVSKNSVTVFSPQREWGFKTRVPSQRKAVIRFNLFRFDQ